MRLIRRLYIQSDCMMKSIRYESKELKNIKKPKKFAKRYYEEVDNEIVLVDIVTSLSRRNSFLKIVKNEIVEFFSKNLANGSKIISLFPMIKLIKVL